MPMRRARQKANLAASLEQGEQATDRVMAGLAASLRRVVEEYQGEPGTPLSLESMPSIMQAVDAELANVYGSRREVADRGQLGRVIVATCHNTRKRVAGQAVQEVLVPAVKGDPLLAHRLGLRRSDTGE